MFFSFSCLLIIIFHFITLLYIHNITDRRKIARYEQMERSWRESTDKLRLENVDLRRKQGLMVADANQQRKTERREYEQQHSPIRQTLEYQNVNVTKPVMATTTNRSNDIIQQNNNNFPSQRIPNRNFVLQRMRLAIIFHSFSKQISFSPKNYNLLAKGNIFTFNDPPY